MHEFLSFDNRILPVSQTFLPAVSPATFYGRGIFTTVAIYNSSVFQWARHWLRLIENARAINVDLSEFAEEAVKNSLSEIISRNGIKTGRARLTFFDRSSSGIWQSENSSAKPSFLITSADFRPVPGALRLNVSTHPVNSKSPLAGVKSCNYLENLLVLETAKKLGFDETIRLNEKDEITSAAMANVFWTQNEEIFTPPLETGALDGTTRDFVLKKFGVREKRASLAALRTADEIFLTSAGLGIVGVQSLEKRSLPGGRIFPEIRSFFDEYILRLS